MSREFDGPNTQEIGMPSQDYVSKQTDLASKDVLSKEEEMELENLENVGEIIAQFSREQEEKPTPIMSRDEVGKVLGRELVGDMQGKTRHVHIDKKDPASVVKIGKSGYNLEEQAAEQEKERRIHGVLHPLFRYNIPKIKETRHLKTPDGKEAIVMVMQRIHEDPNAQIDHPLSKAEEICKKEFGLPRLRDSNEGNIMKDGIDHGEYNTDDILITEEDLISSKQKILNFVNRHDNPGKYSPADKEEINEGFHEIEEEANRAKQQKIAA